MNRKIVRLLLFTLAAAALLLGGATLPEGTARAQDTTETDTTETDAAVAADRAALVALYNSAGGSRWRPNTNWLSEQPLGEWHGVTTNDDGRVTGLRLTRNRMRGTLPAELGDLRNLRVIGLARNDLEGSIPAALGNLGSLERVSLHDNTRLSGALPAEIGDLSGLQRLAISNTGLSGPLSAELTGLTALSQMFFDGTELCAPTDDTFQQWLDGIAQTRGENCASEQ